MLVQFFSHFSIIFLPSRWGHNFLHFSAIFFLQNGVCMYQTIRISQVKTTIQAQHIKGNAKSVPCPYFVFGRFPCFFSLARIFYLFFLSFFLKVARLQSEFRTKDFFQAMNFVTKNAPKFSPKFLSLCSVGQKKSRYLDQPAPKYHTKGCSRSSAASPGARTLVFTAFESFSSCELRASIARTPFCAILWRSPTGSQVKTTIQALHIKGIAKVYPVLPFFFIVEDLFFFSLARIFCLFFLSFFQGTAKGGRQGGRRQFEHGSCFCSGLAIFAQSLINIEQAGFCTFSWQLNTSAKEPTQDFAQRVGQLLINS